MLKRLVRIAVVALSLGWEPAVAADQSARIEPNGAFETQIECQSASDIEKITLGEVGLFLFEIKSKTACDMVDRSLNVYFKVERCEGPSALVTFLKNDMIFDRRAYVSSTSVIPYIKDKEVLEVCRYDLWQWWQDHQPSKNSLN